MPEGSLQFYKERVEHLLDQHLVSAEVHPQRLHQAMRYAVLGGGKRLRPVLVYTTGVAVGAELACLDSPAMAVELIHAYSLVHDDLPAMDDDHLRHGKPTCHKAFDEATALLAGDAIQTLAFQMLSHDSSGVQIDALRLKMVNILAQAAGSRGMAGGQAIDLDAVGKDLTLAELENMHIHKTGALIRASVLLGATCQADLASSTLQKLDHYAKCIGLAFQICDDILDETADTQILGKQQGADKALNKPTYPALLGVQGARKHAQTLVESALDSLTDFGVEMDTLRWIASYIIERPN
jgi:farnesyl diphosphate synthase